jgi:hypothetical protein
VTTRLEAAGLEVRATAVREPEFDHEQTPQAFVIAREIARYTSDEFREEVQSQEP